MEPLVNITGHLRPTIAWQGGNDAGSGLYSEGVRRRFWAKVRVLESDTACWEWLASRTSNGRYGQFTWASRYGRNNPIGAHRAAWELTNGDIPADLRVLHSCDNPVCVRPDHLFLGTQLDNMRDASEKGRLAVARRRTRAAKEIAVARYLAGGVTMRQLAAEYSVHMMTVHRWLKGLHEPYQRAPRGDLSSIRGFVCSGQKESLSPWKTIKPCRE